MKGMVSKNGELIYIGTDIKEKKWFDEIIGQGGNAPEAPVVPTEPVTENTTYTDKNGKTAIIPKGFKVSSVESEQLIDDGLVVIAPDAVGSEFVWIPVNTASDFARVDWGKGNTIAKTPEDKTTAEYIAMKKSVVEDYHGYYLSRYEAGIPGTTSSVTTGHNTKADGSIKPISKKGVGVWNFIAWGANNNTVTPGNGAVTVARSMFPNDDTNATGVVSTLCYDIQWDTALKFIQTKDTNYPINSTGKGNYGGTNGTGDTFGSIAVTGGHPNFMLNNISDMAGNVWDWTMATYSTSYRVGRGGYYSHSGTGNPAAYRGNLTYNYSSGNGIGFRVGLYIK